MNKTVTINLGGYVFHIDEDAYQTLKKYLSSIANSLKDSEEAKKEIISDIESRISELLSAKLKDDKQVINESNIKDIIEIMGQPEDFSDEDETTSYSTENKSNTSTNKKMYRDGENNYIGGVASGMGYYFGIDALWVRILFMILFFSGGFGFPIYVLLWILVPMAKTTAEKLEMVGEAVNIDNIGRKIRNEFDNIDYEKTKNGIQKFLNTIGNLIIGMFKIAAKFFGLILIVLSLVFFTTISVVTLTKGKTQFLNLHYHHLKIQYLLENSVLPGWLLLTFLFVLVTIPSVMLFASGLRIVSNRIKKMNSAVSITLFLLWIIALVGIIYTSINYNSKRIYTGYSKQQTTLPINVSDTLRVKMLHNEQIFHPIKYRQNHIPKIITLNNEERVYSRNVYLDIKKSNTEDIVIKVLKRINGVDRQNANDAAQSIEYNYTLNPNNEILIDSHFLSSVENLFKGEKVVVSIHIPNKTYLHLHPNTTSYIRHSPKVNNKWFRARKHVNKYLEMTSKGFIYQSWIKE